MSHSLYSLMGSQIQIIIKDEIADRYNKYEAALNQAKIDYENREGCKWNKQEPLFLVNVDKEDRAAYKAVYKLIDLICKINEWESLNFLNAHTTSNQLEKL